MIGIVFDTDRRFHYLQHYLEKNGINIVESKGSYQLDFVLFGLKGPDQFGKIQIENGDVLSFDENWFETLPHHCIIASYLFNAYLKKMAEQFALTYWTMETDEILTRTNANLTAEACISEIIKRRPFALSGSRISILGYGRIAQALAKMLEGFRIEGTVVLRSHAYDLEINKMGYRVCHFQDEEFLNADLIINTVPATVLYDKHLEKLNRQTMLVELASFPYGFDSVKAMSLGLEVALLLGLPAKYAYASSAIAMSQALYRQLEKRM